MQLVQELTRPQGTTSVTWSSDGSKLAAYTVAPGPLSIDGKLLTVWNAEGQILREIEPPDFFFSSDDPLAFVAGGTQLATPPWFKSITLGFMVFDIKSGKVVREIEGPRPDGGRPDNAAWVLVSSPDQSMLAVVFGAFRSRPVTLYSTRDWSKVELLPDSGEDILAFSPNGRFLAATEPGRVRFYDVASRQFTQTTIDMFTGPTSTLEDRFRVGILHAVSFNPDGTLIAVAYGHTDGPKIPDPVRIFRVADGVRVGSFPKPLLFIHCLAWSPNGHVIAFIASISGWGDRELHLWDPSQPENERIVKLTGHAASLAFSPDGTRLALAHGNKVAIYGVTR